jgi:hypothetical protein
MAGIGIPTARAADMMFSSPYVDETLSFVVPDHWRVDFSSAEWVRAALDLRVVVPDLANLEQLVRWEFPMSRSSLCRSTAWRTSLPDAVSASTDSVYPAERGPYVTLLRRAFAVAALHPLTIRFPLAYPW